MSSTSVLGQKKFTYLKGWGGPQFFKADIDKINLLIQIIFRFFALSYPVTTNLRHKENYMNKE
jgi:hypothetical protein